jgi:hypothetical protein
VNGLGEAVRERQRRAHLGPRQGARLRRRRRQPIRIGDGRLSPRGRSARAEREAEKALAKRLESVELAGVDGPDPNLPRRIRFKGMLAPESRDTSFYLTKAKQIVADTQAGRSLRDLGV